MKDNMAERRRVAALADRYFAEQCARLGPVQGGPVQRKRRRVSSLDKLDGMDRAAPAQAMTRPAFSRQRLGSHAGGDRMDRFRL